MTGIYRHTIAMVSWGMYLFCGFMQPELYYLHNSQWYDAFAHPRNHVHAPHGIYNCRSFCFQLDFEMPVKLVVKFEIKCISRTRFD